jgi:hypothetical protein
MNDTITNNGDSMSTEETKTYASESDVAHDLLAIIDEAPHGRLVGSEETTLESVELHKQPISGTATRIVVELSNGQKFALDVREIESAS